MSKISMNFWACIYCRSDEKPKGAVQNQYMESNFVRLHFEWDLGVVTTFFRHRANAFPIEWVGLSIWEKSRNSNVFEEFWMWGKVPTLSCCWLFFFSLVWTMAEDKSDPFKNSIWRFLGYANEVGEAMRPWVPLSVVWSTYVVAIGYASADTYHKAELEYRVRHWRENGVRGRKGH